MLHRIFFCFLWAAALFLGGPLAAQGINVRQDAEGVLLAPQPSSPVWRLAGDGAEATISPSQAGLGWADGRVTLQSPVGALQFYETGSPLEPVIYWPGRVVTHSFEAVNLFGDLGAASITRGAGEEVLGPELVAASIMSPLSEWIGLEIYAGANGVPYVSDSDAGGGFGMEAVDGVYFPQGVVSGAVGGTSFWQGRYRDAAQMRADLDLEPGVDVASAADLTTHITNPTGAHAASAISAVPTGGLAGTDVAAQLAELESNKLDADGDGSGLTGLTKSQVGLGNVDNTSDATKNAATATLTNKDLSSSTNTYRAATDAQAGAVELATQAERILGLDTTRVLTVADIKANWQGDFRWDFLRNAGVTNGSGGNAALTTNGAHTGSAQTGATAGAFTIYSAAMPRSFGFSPTTGNTPNWAAPIGIQVELASISTTANGYIRFLFGGSGGVSSTPITISRNGIGFEVRDLRLWLLCHNNSIFTEQDTGVDLTPKSAAYAVFIYSDGAGNVSIYVDGVQAGTTATGGPTTITTNSSIMHLIQSNESDAANVRWSVNSPIKIIFGL